MEPASVRVLLVDETVSDASHLVTYLKNPGCLCALSRSFKEACVPCSSRNNSISYLATSCCQGKTVTSCRRY
jgi:hypothetical protein